MVARMAETGQRCDEPLHRKKEGRSTQDTLAEPGLGGDVMIPSQILSWNH
jgi:hypothetical protein